MIEFRLFGLMMRKLNYKKILLAVFYFTSLNLFSFSEEDSILAEDKSSSVSSVVVMKLNIVKPANYYFKGRVESVQKVILSFDLPGKLNKILGVGELVYSPVVDKNGKIIREGTIVASYIKKRIELNLEIVSMAKKAAESQLELAKRTLHRIESLVKKEVIADKFYWEVKNDYLNACINLDIARNKLQEAKYNLASCTLYSPFSGIVCNVNQTLGDWVKQGTPVIEIMKMDPVIIRVTLPYEIKSIIKENSLAYVYPSGIKKPIQAYIKKNDIDKDSVLIFLSNYTLYENSDVKSLKFSQVNQLYKVSLFFGKDEIESGKFDNRMEELLTVPVNSIRHDDKGYFVFKAVKYKKNEISFLSDNILKLERIDIVPGDIIKDKFIDSTSSITTQTLKKRGSLKAGDIVIGDLTQDFKNNDIVVHVDKRWLFYPEQLVKVRIPLLNRKGVYVPLNSVIYQGENDTFVYLAKNGKAKLTKVRVVSFNGDYYSIVGKGISPGGKVIVFKDSTQLAALYDGKKITIDKVLPSPSFLEYKNAFEINPPGTNSIQSIPKQPTSEDQ